MKKLPTIAVLLAGILWGSLGIFIRRLSAAGFTSLQIVFARVLFGALLLIFYALFKDRQLLKLRVKDLWCFVGSGITGFAFFNYCYFTTMQYASLCVAAVLLYTAPIIVMVLSALLFHEKITRKKLFALLLAFGGCICAVGLLSGDVLLTVPGLFIGLGAGLGYALVTVFTRYALNRGYTSITIVIYTLLFAAAAVFCMTDVRPVFQYCANIRNLLFLILFILTGTIAPNMLYTWGMSRMDNDTASIIVSIEPIAATVIGVIAFGEQLSADTILGIGLMTVALIVLNLKSSAKSDPSSDSVIYINS